MKPDLIIFDCDGTIADTELAHQKALISALAEDNIVGYDIDFCIDHFAGKGINYVVDVIEQREGRKLSDNFVDRYIHFYLNDSNGGAVPVPDAVEAVKALSINHKICVASNGEVVNVDYAVKSIGLYDLFGKDRIFTKSQVARGKPAPDLFLFAADQMGVAPEQCIVIEDSIAGVTAGLAAGMLTIGITAVSHDSVQIAEDMKKAGVQHIYRSWPEILSFINGLAEAHARNVDKMKIASCNN